MKLRNKKTGEIVETHLLVVQSVEDPTKRYYTSSIKDLCDNYEDYKPAEQLIKDESIRKALRTWAEANDITQLSYDAHWNAFRCADFVIAFNYDFDRHDGLKDGISYSIAELCGEEEE